MTTRPARPTRMRRALAVIAAATAVSLTLSGCIYSMIPEDDAGASSNGSTSGGQNGIDPTAGVPEELASFYEQELEWADCAGAFECTSVTAPLNWDDPAAGEIELAVVRQPATSGQSEGAVLTNPGGPGGSGVEFLTTAVPMSFTSEMQARRDIVSWDPRGVQDSTAVTCLDGDDKDEYLYELPGGSRGSQEWTEDLEQKAEEFAEACQENSDGILEFMTTVQSAHDLDLLRGVLGEGELDYLGFSYGTFLGATYASLHPERVGEFVLDGAIDPSVPSSAVGLTQALGFEQALNSFLEACVAGDLATECPFTGSLDNARADLSVLLETLDARPIEAPDGREFNADTMMLAIIMGLYQADAWPYIADAIALAMQRGSELGFLLADLYNGRTGPGAYSDNSTEAFTAYNCMDYPEESEAVYDEVEQAIQDGAPLIAPYWVGADTCQYWPFEPSGTRAEITAEGAGEIVVIGTTGDPATPYEWSVALVDQLAEGVLVTNEGEGHTAYSVLNTCVADVVDDFLLDGVVPEDQTVCS